MGMAEQQEQYFIGIYVKNDIGVLIMLQYLKS
jgi:hypothetical protein